MKNIVWEFEIFYKIHLLDTFLNFKVSKSSRIPESSTNVIIFFQIID